MQKYLSSIPYKYIYSILDTNFPYHFHVEAGTVFMNWVH